MGGKPVVDLERVLKHLTGEDKTPKGKDLLASLEEMGWKKVYADKIAVVYVREEYQPTQYQLTK